MKLNKNYFKPNKQIRNPTKQSIYKRPNKPINI